MSKTKKVSLRTLQTRLTKAAEQRRKYNEQVIEIENQISGLEAPSFGVGTWLQAASAIAGDDDRLEWNREWCEDEYGYVLKTTHRYAYIAWINRWYSHSNFDELIAVGKSDIHYVDFSKSIPYVVLGVEEMSLKDAKDSEQVSELALLITEPEIVSLAKQLDIKESMDEYEGLSQEFVQINDEWCRIKRIEYL